MWSETHGSQDSSFNQSQVIAGTNSSNCFVAYQSYYNHKNTFQDLKKLLRMFLSCNAFASKRWCFKINKFLLFVFFVEKYLNSSFRVTLLSLQNLFWVELINCRLWCNWSFSWPVKYCYFAACLPYPFYRKNSCPGSRCPVFLAAALVLLLAIKRNSEPAGTNKFVGFISPLKM